MRIALLVAVFAVSAFGQFRGFAAPAAGRGRPMPPAPTHPVSPSPFRPVNPVPPRPNIPRTVAVPYPVFVGGGYYDPGYAPAPPPDQAPVAWVNPGFQPDRANPQMIDFSNAPEPASAESEDADAAALRDDQPTIFLIALTDHSVLAAIAYWVDGDTLNWVSRDAKQNHISLSLVDREFSRQLNDERHIPFKLPSTPRPE
ncbi:MAG TPA: hypothetical protein VMT15_06135 [Bryobacteraceae bacterium]|nr:hypothetical protein [Bryobacteraceae bacterium]